MRTIDKNNIIWKPIKDCPMYLVSEQGDVWSVKKNKTLKQSVNRGGYYFVHLLNKDEGKYKSYLVHRLVAIAFIPNSDNKETVNHKNFNKCDNVVENLEWMSRTENTKHAWKNGGVPSHRYKDYQFVVDMLIEHEFLGKFVDWRKFEKRYHTTKEQVLAEREKEYGISFDEMKERYLARIEEDERILAESFEMRWNK